MRQIYESITALEIENSMLFKFFPTILFYHVSSYLSWLFLAEIVIPIGVPSKEAKAEIEIYPENVEAKIKKVFNII